MTITAPTPTCKQRKRIDVGTNPAGRTRLRIIDSRLSGTAGLQLTISSPLPGPCAQAQAVRRPQGPRTRPQCCTAVVSIRLDVAFGQQRGTLKFLVAQAEQLAEPIIASSTLHAIDTTLTRDAHGDPVLVVGGEFCVRDEGGIFTPHLAVPSATLEGDDLDHGLDLAERYADSVPPTTAASPMSAPTRPPLSIGATPNDPSTRAPSLSGPRHRRHASLPCLTPPPPPACARASRRFLATLTSR